MSHDHKLDDPDMISAALKDKLGSEESEQARKVYKRVATEQVRPNELNDSERYLYERGNQILRSLFTPDAVRNWYQLLSEESVTVGTQSKRSAYHLSNFSFDLRGVISATPPRIVTGKQ